MSDFQTEMNKAVQGFVAQITECARRAAIDTLETALQNGPIAARARGRGAKRTPDELDKISEDFVEFVRANPGMRIEQINKQLSLSTHDLALPIRKLIAEGAIKVKGQKRSTTYFASDSVRKKKAKN